VSARAGRLRTSRLAPLDFFAAVAAVIASLVVGASLVSRPTVALLPVAALAAALLIVDPRARIAFVLFGGLFLLQTTGGVDVKKLAFLAGVGVAFVGALTNVQRLRETSTYRLARPLLAASIVFAALAALSLPVAHTNGIPPQQWLRDIAPYLLFASAPVFALDAQAAIGTRMLLRLLIAVGTLGAIAFAVQWFQRRGIAQLPDSRVSLATLFIPAALFTYAMSAALQATRRRARWICLAASLLAMLAATSTRSTFALVIAPLAIAVGMRRQLTARSVRLLAAGPIAVVLTLALTQAAFVVTGANQDVLQKRLEVLKSTGDEKKDASYNDRVTETRVAWAAFKENPIVGAGPGTTFEWKPQGSRELRSSFVLDTPVTFPAKFGLLGLVALAIIVAKYFSFVLALARRREPSVAQLALRAYLAVVVALAIFKPPFEDKGLSLGLILLLALALREADRATASTPT
jgi:O-antigen ligase